MGIQSRGRNTVWRLQNLCCGSQFEQESPPHGKVGLAKATHKVVYVDYEKLERKLKKCEEELVNVKATMDKLQAKIKGKYLEMVYLR